MSVSIDEVDVRFGPAVSSGLLGGDMWSKHADASKAELALKLAREAAKNVAEEHAYRHCKMRPPKKDSRALRARLLLRQHNEHSPSVLGSSPEQK